MLTTFHLKVRLQAQSVYRGIFHCVAKTYSHEGVGVPSSFGLLLNEVVQYLLFFCELRSVDSLGACRFRF